MVRHILFVCSLIVIWGNGFIIGMYSVGKGNYVIPKDKWMCAIEHIATKTCVAYSINEDELQKYINPRHREHNLPERQPLLDTK